MMQATKPAKATFGKAEYEWFNYRKTLEEINSLRESIKNPYDAFVDENIGAGSNSVRVPGRPTERIAIKMIENKKLKHLTEIIHAIETVYNVLPDDYKKLVRTRYWSNRNLSWDGIALELHVHRSTAVRWRGEIIRATIELLGWR